LLVYFDYLLERKLGLLEILVVDFGCVVEIESCLFSLIFLSPLDFDVGSEGWVGVGSFYL
jgi:hypothetical protein